VKPHFFVLCQRLYFHVNLEKDKGEGRHANLGYGAVMSAGWKKKSDPQLVDASGTAGFIDCDSEELIISNLVEDLGKVQKSTAKRKAYPSQRAENMTLFRQNQD